MVITGHLTINITGGVKGETNLVTNPISFLLTVDKGMVKDWGAYWDNQDAAMLAALSKVSAKMS